MSDVGDPQALITEFWNAVATHYDRHPGNTAAPDSDEYSQWLGLLRRTLPARPGRVLDVCTGTGFTALICASLGHEVAGIDLAQQMLQVARSAGAERGLDATFVEGDAIAPEFEPGTFDVVTCRHALWTLRRADTAIANWHRLLRPGGRVIVMDSFHAWRASDSSSAQEQFFHSHYTDDVQAAIPFMHVKDEAPLIEAFVRSGYEDVTFELLDAKFGADEAHVPYVLIAVR